MYYKKCQQIKSKRKKKLTCGLRDDMFQAFFKWPSFQSVKKKTKKNHPYLAFASERDNDEAS